MNLAMNNHDLSSDPSGFNFYGQPWNFHDDASQQQSQVGELGFCQYSDWDSDKIYDDDPPNYLQYSTEWKVVLNKRMISKDTEQGIVLSPADSWDYVLEDKLNNIKRSELADRAVISKDTAVVVSVTQRGVLPLTRRFNLTAIDWTVVERQLIEWSEYFRAGKKLRLSISFNYVDAPQSTTASLQRTGRRGRPSRTQQMLAERDEQLNAEEASSGQPSVLLSVYRVMRCSGHPCQLGPYCWVDPVGKKHYKLGRTQIESLVRYVQQGFTLQSHDDIPDDIRQQLYTAAEQSLERHKKPASTSTAAVPPFNINVLPASCPTCRVSSPSISKASNKNSNSTPIDPLDIDGLLDEQVEDYCAWQQSRVKRTTLKAEYKKACDVILGKGLDLELIRQKSNHDFLTKEGILEGTAERVVRDIDYWVRTTKRARTGEYLVNGSDL